MMLLKTWCERGDVYKVPTDEFATCLKAIGGD